MDILTPKSFLSVVCRYLDVLAWVRGNLGHGTLVELLQAVPWAIPHASPSPPDTALWRLPESTTYMASQKLLWLQDRKLCSQVKSFQSPLFYRMQDLHVWACISPDISIGRTLGRRQQSDKGWAWSIIETYYAHWNKQSMSKGFSQLHSGSLMASSWFKVSEVCADAK